jgi:hypothetical protein
MTRVSVGRLGRVTDDMHRTAFHLKPMQGPVGTYPARARRAQCESGSAGSYLRS